MGRRRAQGLVKAVDTNILARFLIRDDVAQTAAADRIMGEDILLTPTVLLETAWLLASRFRLSRGQVADGLVQIISLNNIYLAEESGARWAIEKMRSGADFADMLHLLEARDADCFITFDHGVAKAAGDQSPIPIQTLKS